MMIDQDRMTAKECFLFDAGNTLIRLHPSREELLQEIFIKHGFETTIGQVKVAFMLSDDMINLGGFTTLSKEKQRVFWMEYTSGLMDTIGLPKDDLENIARSVSETFCAPRSWSPFSDVFGTIGKLKESGCTLGVVSNAETCLRAILEENQLAKHFDTIVISEEVGVEKPDPSIFQKALDKLDFTPDKCVHIGDTIEADVIGARSAGITPVWLDRERLGKHTPDLIKTYTLADIPAMFRLPDDWRL
jgi:putative hydrolase of the HAD superfamily